MKQTVREWNTKIILEGDEPVQICGLGSGENCCIQMVAGSDGFECMALNRMPIISLLDRYAAGETNAKRCGCEFFPNDWKSTP
jgi:hypothetical protein